MDIKRVIQEHGWTLERLAAKMTNKKKDEIGISHAAVSQIINGNPTLDKLKEIASIMNISLSELLADDEIPAKINCPYCGKSITIKTEQ